MDAETRLKFIKSRLKRERPTVTKPVGLFRSAHPGECPEPRKTGYVKPVNHGGHRAVFGVLVNPAYRRPEWVRVKDVRSEGLKVKPRQGPHVLTVIAGKWLNRHKHGYDLG